MNTIILNTDFEGGARNTGASRPPTQSPRTKELPKPEPKKPKGGTYKPKPSW